MRNSARQEHDRSRSNAARGAVQNITIDLTKIVFGDIEPTLYSDVAERAAETISNAKRDQNKPSQLRRFYDELVMLQDKVGSSPQNFKKYHPFIQMLKAKVAYAQGRNKVDINFAALLRHVVGAVKDSDTLKQARLFMEAFMAFYKVYRPSESGEGGSWNSR